MFDHVLRYRAGKNLKPYQGLKQSWTLPAEAFNAVASRKKPKTLSGIETAGVVVFKGLLAPEKT